MAEPQLIRTLAEFEKNPLVTYDLEDRIVEYKGKKPENYINNIAPVWNGLLNQYGENVGLISWKERTLATENILDSINGNNVHIKGASIDSYSIDAFRKGYWGKDIKMEDFPFNNWIILRMS